MTPQLIWTIPDSKQPTKKCSVRGGGTRGRIFKERSRVAFTQACNRRRRIRFESAPTLDDSPSVPFTQSPKWMLGGNDGAHGLPSLCRVQFEAQFARPPGPVCVAACQDHLQTARGRNIPVPYELMEFLEK